MNAKTNLVHLLHLTLSLKHWKSDLVLHFQYNLSSGVPCIFHYIEPNLTFGICILLRYLLCILVTPILRLAFCATAMMKIALCVAKISTSYCRFKTSAEIAFQKTKKTRVSFLFFKAAVFTLHLRKQVLQENCP